MLPWLLSTCILFTGYKQTRSCLSQEVLIDQARQCNATFAMDMNNIPMHGYSMQQVHEYMCSCITSLITCIRDFTHETCGTSEAEWIYNMKIRMMRASMTEINCKVNSHKQHIPVILAISFAVLIAVLVILFTFLIIYRKIKNEDKKLLQKKQSNSMNRLSTKNTVREKQSFQTSSMKRGSQKCSIQEELILLQDVQGLNSATVDSTCSSHLNLPHYNKFSNSPDSHSVQNEEHSQNEKCFESNGLHTTDFDTNLSKNNLLCLDDDHHQIVKTPKDEAVEIMECLADTSADADNAMLKTDIEGITEKLEDFVTIEEAVV